MKNISAVEKKDCCGCGACHNICPVSAIAMKADQEGFSYPAVDEDICIQCGKCVQACPACHMPAVNHEKYAYAAYARSEQTHRASSSGGIFAVLAAHYLETGGYVCGAAFDDHLRLRHVLISESDALPAVKETKYVQSDIGMVFRQIRDKLENGKDVLFCGTPCQAAGLKGYLGKEYDSLLIMDLVCHGVPSPAVFSEYIREIGQNHPVVKMSFRDKSEGMDHIYLTYELNNGETVREKYSESDYIKGFIQNLIIRPSCFSCRFKGIDRCSDITIGDFWGLNDFHPDMLSSQGTSAVLIHTEKGRKRFLEILPLLKTKEVKPQEIAAWNECLIHPVACNEKREIFFRRRGEMNIRENLEELFEQPAPVKKIGILGRIKRKIRSVIQD